MYNSDKQSDTTAVRLKAAAAKLSTSPKDAFEVAKRILDDDPQCASAFRIMAAALRLHGDPAQAEKAESAANSISLRHPSLTAATNAIRERRANDAERILRDHLSEQPGDPPALRALGNIAAGTGHWDAAEKLFRSALQSTPSFDLARRDLAILLDRQNRPDEAIAEIDILIQRGQTAPRLSLKAEFLEHSGRVEEALAVNSQMIEVEPSNASIWVIRSGLLRSLGQIDAADEAARQALRLDPNLAIAWYALSDIKRVRLSEVDMAAMRSALDQVIGDDDRALLNFALGKAWEDTKDFQSAFEHYTDANALCRRATPYAASATTSFVERTRQLITPTFFQTRKGMGDHARGPIFVIGMHRSGSSLVEQILASHSQVEGLSELVQLEHIANRLAPAQTAPYGFLDALPKLDGPKLKAIGSDYLRRVAPYRRTDRPFHIDKMPDNWRYVPLIHLCLPNAIIIDVRRNPLDCCLSVWKQKFAKGRGYSYDLADMGAYYRDYVHFMRHIDAVLPGRVHRVIHERLVDDFENEVRALLAHCGLEFETGCLEFHKTERAVRTPSAAQVRRPINRDSLERWRAYEPWLEPLKKGLGSVVDDYRE